METTETWPKPLLQANGPMRRDKLDGAAEGMGKWGEETRALAAEGWIPPDMMTGLTLFLLSNQPRDPQIKQVIPGGGGGVAGGVWVRERFTIHRPLRREEIFNVSGDSIGRHVHKGRRYGTTRSVTMNSQGQRAASNLTTGLLAYKVEKGLVDRLEGCNPDEIEPFGPDWDLAENNPHRQTLRSLKQGDTFGGHEVVIGISLMQARDTDKPDNPIHSDPELAKKAGLAKPIAGGSHVLSFPLENIMQAVGRYALLHGAAFDVRWRAPVYADVAIRPHVMVAAVSPDRVRFSMEAMLDTGVSAMVGEVTVPLV
jgi:hypothetical protein